MPPPRLRLASSSLRILHNQGRLYSVSTSTSSPLPPPPPPSGAANLNTTRRLLAVQGRDAAHFLHGITTATVRASQTNGFYSTFLNAQGRVLNDVFIYPATHNEAYRKSLSEKLAQDISSGGEAFLIEVDAKEVEVLWKHLKKYKLRAKVDVRVVVEGEWNVWSLWDGEKPWTPHPSPPTPAISASSAPSSTFATAQDTGDALSAFIGCVDARGPGMGRRLLLPSSTSLASTLQPSEFIETNISAYSIRRMVRGIPEGQGEIPHAAALPQEYNIDFMGGIDFKKGCYVGQELTIRTHHTGVVRKRILPVMLYTSASSETAAGKPENLRYDPYWSSGEVAQGTNIVPAAGKVGRSAGKWITGVGNVGLGLCRIEMMTDIVLTAEGGSRWKEEDEFRVDLSSPEFDIQKYDGGRGEVRIKAFVPDWHRSKTKVRKPQVRV